MESKDPPKTVDEYADLLLELATVKKALRQLQEKKDLGAQVGPPVIPRPHGRGWRMHLRSCQAAMILGVTNDVLWRLRKHGKLRDLHPVSIRDYLASRFEVSDKHREKYKKWVRKQYQFAEEFGDEIETNSKNE